jgi:UTP--glucose-1-phosphate uridylyltransferase
MSTAIRSIDDAVLHLGPYGFTTEAQATFAARATSPGQTNAVTGALAVMGDDAVSRLPALGSPEREALRQEGLALIKAGKVGVVVLAGGMATRFGGVVKAVVPALGDQSFLQLKANDITAVAAHAGGKVPLFVMSSFSTHEVIKAHVAEKGIGDENVSVEVFPQKVALRLNPEGGLFVTESGELSPYATGHGDLTAALRSSGVLTRFVDGGGTTLFMTNVDNLGATLDPAMVALHHRLGGAITAEVVEKLPGDAGGAPALLDGVPQIIEGFRFPTDFDQTRIGVFNTNTFFFDATTLDTDFPLPFYRVEKKVEGKTAIQFERLVGELTALLPSRFVVVPRTGEDARFIPVKDPGDLDTQQALIAQVTASARSTG